MDVVDLLKRNGELSDDLEVMDTAELQEHLLADKVALCLTQKFSTSLNTVEASMQK